MIMLISDQEKNNYFMVGSLSNTEERRRVDIANITHAVTIGLS
jgi:hypothetical protein